MNTVRVLLLAVAVPAIVLLYLPIRIGAGSGWTVDLGPLRFGGPFLIAFGTLLYFWGVADFPGARRVPADGPRFVAQGPYRVVRNPLYIGGLLILTGHGLWFQSPTLVPYTLLVFAAFHLFIVAYEEPALRRRFGSDYEAYCLTVRRWIPRRPETGDERR